MRLKVAGTGTSTAADRRADTHQVAAHQQSAAAAIHEHQQRPFEPDGVGAALRATGAAGSRPADRMDSWTQTAQAAKPAALCGGVRWPTPPAVFTHSTSPARLQPQTVFSPQPGVFVGRKLPDRVA
jgi:hypothetical protein